MSYSNSHAREDRVEILPLFGEVMRVYHSHFWIYFPIAMAASVVCSVFLYAMAHRIHDLTSQLTAENRFGTVGIEIFLTRISAFFLSWFVSTLAFAAIFSATEEVLSGGEPDYKECIRTSTQRLRPLLILSLILFPAFVTVVVIELLLYSILVARSGVAPPFWLGAYVGYATIVIAGWIISRFGLAVPAIVREKCSAVRSLFRSDDLTEGCWKLLAVLVLESIVGGYLGYMIPYWLLGNMPNSSVLEGQISSWLLAAVSVLCATVLQPPMFIGFSMLYIEKTRAVQGNRVFVVSASAEGLGKL